MSQTKSLGIQCESRRSTGVQTKRLNKDEMRYFTKIIEKEKQVLLKFLEATNGKRDIQPYFKVNMHPMQTRLLKKHAARKKTKRKNKRKHSSLNVKHNFAKNSVPPRHVDQESGDTAHYVSKIVVDDNTRSLKLSFKSCNPRKSSSSNEFKENEKSANYKERARSRKTKQPRRVCRTYDSKPKSLATGKNNENFNIPDKVTPSPAQLPPSPKKAETTKHEIKPEPVASKSDCVFASAENSNDHTDTNSLLPSTISEDDHQNRSQVSIRSEKTDCLLASIVPCDRPFNSIDASSNSDDEKSHNQTMSTNSDGAESDCSEEFFIIEPRKTGEENTVQEPENDQFTATVNGKPGEDHEDVVSEKDESDITILKTELKKRLQASMIRKQIDKTQSLSSPGSEVQSENSEGLPQVVSVHFYDPENRCQRVIDPNTHITQYARSDGTHVLLNNPSPPSSSMSPPLQHPAVVSTSQSSPEPRLSVVHSPVTPTKIPSIHHSYSPYYHPAATTPAQSSSVTYANSLNVRPNTTRPSYQPTYLIKEIASNVPHNVQNLPPATSTVPGYVGTDPPAISTEGTSVSATNVEEQVEKVQSSEKREARTLDVESRGTKRKRFIFGADEPQRKKVISSLLTPLCEREATRLADGIHEINMQYFPLRSLAQKAANRVSEDTDDVLKLIDQKIQLKAKIQDVEKARNLLKDIYDMVLKSKEIEDIQNFELVSHNFGVRNILNHLSLVDLYFGELGTELQSKI